ncbi:MAG: PIG-L family deacetylase [Actinomycetota bacterium]|nr:PIG-L family deacetylase [Actinomycetota bacterium]
MFKILTVKILAIAIAAIIIIFGLLYAMAPYLIRFRMAKIDVKAEPSRYGGIDELPKKESILFVTAHPDDLEFMAGGTLPKLIDRKNDVYLALLTNGGKQEYMPSFYSRRIIKTRHDEQLKIGRLEGLKKVFFINYPDGSLKYSDEAVAKVAKIATQVKATHLFTFEPSSKSNFRSSDHSVAGEIGTAVAKNNESIKALYYFRAENPNIIVDTSDTFNQKLEILFMFTEFKYKGRMLRAMHEAWDSLTGKRIGVKYGEGFQKIALREKVEPVGAIPVKEKTN